jgi:hypothetical protein
LKKVSLISINRKLRIGVSAQNYLKLIIEVEGLEAKRKRDEVRRSKKIPDKSEKPGHYGPKK